MKEITLNAYAKINLSIDVLGKRTDGYHQVLMVMEQIDLYDLVKVVWMDGNEAESKEHEKISIELSTNLKFLLERNKNIAYKAAILMIENYKKDGTGHINIEIEKRIPVAAGLAGGSANGAAVLHALNILWGLGLDLEELFELGVKLGADVPFCLAGQAALNPVLCLQQDLKAGTCAVASGIGEQLQFVHSLDSWVLLSKPPIFVSTAQVYNGLNLLEIKEHPDIAELVAGLKEKNYYKVSKNMINVLETYSLKEYPIIVYTKNKIIEEGKPYCALMSGSGPTVFGLFTSKNKGKEAYSRLKYLNKETYLVKTL